MGWGSLTSTVELGWFLLRFLGTKAWLAGNYACDGSRLCCLGSLIENMAFTHSNMILFAKYLI